MDQVVSVSQGHRYHPFLEEVVVDVVGGVPQFACQVFVLRLDAIDDLLEDAVAISMSAAICSVVGGSASIKAWESMSNSLHGFGGTVHQQSRSPTDAGS